MKRTESLGSFTRSAAQATSSAYRSLPIRGRLAGGSAALTFVILCGFASIVGVLTTRQVRSQFNDEMSSAVEQLAPSVLVGVSGNRIVGCETAKLSDYASAEQAQIRIYAAGIVQPICSQRQSNGKPATTPAFVLTAPGVSEQYGYRVVVRQIDLHPTGDGFLLYARPLSEVQHTLKRVQFFLVLGVIGGTVLALLAGLAIAQRAMRPVARLTDAAREIQRTRDPNRRLPAPDADDEVGELSRTLDAMLGALADARTETEVALDRQREFVADASHELRTPLTSVLANLELLAEELEGEPAETAAAALRSTRRMRRLVADLLLLARADAHRVAPHRPTDVADVLLDVASEIEPVAGDHELTVEANPAVVDGAPDELHRMLLNLIDNAITHTPPGTRILASVRVAGEVVVVVVEDDGPGIPEELRGRLFERFVRRAGDGGRGSGLGLAIVKAVAESHGGTVEVRAGIRGGARFEVRLPPAGQPSASRPEGRDSLPEVVQTSTTTGSTIGRRRNRS